MKAIDLFCGCGGITKGLLNAGFDVLLGVDSMKEARETYQLNFNHKFILGDLRSKEVKKKVVEYVHSVLGSDSLDLIAGGFPCQGFSLSGKRDKRDSRNFLYLDMLDLVDCLRPNFVFMENVKGILSMGIDVIVKAFERIGYVLNWKVLNAADFGVPQKRERVIFVGNRLGLSNIFPDEKGSYVSVGKAIGDLIDRGDDKSFNHVKTKHSLSVVNRLSKVAQGGCLYKGYSDSWRRAYWDRPSFTIKENHGGVGIHPILDRVFTVRECLRLQGFPDDFVLSGSKSKQLVQVGNAVPPQLAEKIGKKINERNTLSRNKK